MFVCNCLKCIICKHQRKRHAAFLSFFLHHSFSQRFFLAFFLSHFFLRTIFTICCTAQRLKLNVAVVVVCGEQYLLFAGLATDTHTYTTIMYHGRCSLYLTLSLLNCFPNSFASLPEAQQTVNLCMRCCVLATY